jgi:hypothetical protein
VFSLDLNEFLTVDAQQYLAQLLTVTYLVMDCDRLAAFFSLSNDKLTCAPDDTGAKKVWNRIQRRIPNIKRRRSYPAVKIGRLGVCGTMQGGGVGQQILDWLKILFLTANRTPPSQQACPYPCAREDRLGLWRAGGVVEPWVYRARRR